MKDKLEVKIFGSGLIIMIVAIIVINFFMLRMQKADITSVAINRLASTAMVITKGIERTMIEANPEVTKSFIEDIKSIESFQFLEVYNSEGRVAFAPGTEAVEAEAARALAVSDSDITYVEGTSVYYYIPLKNQAVCRTCHTVDGSILGLVKLSISLEKENEKISEFIAFLMIGSFVGLGVLGFLFWHVLRKFVIIPVKKLEDSAHKMAGGDLSFLTDIDSEDEIGRLNKSIKDSLLSISGILRRMKDVSVRIADTAEAVENDSSMVSSSTQIEAEAVNEISSSIEELNYSISEIADSTESLSSSVEDTASSIEQMTMATNSLKLMTHDVSEGVDATSSSIEQLSATIKEVADNAGELARVSDETLAAVDEIMSSVKEIETSAKSSARLSEKVKEDALNLGVVSINKTRKGMEHIRESVKSTAVVIEKLVSRSDDIGNILTVIDEITDQTTLLALNAAILAAQAGEHGKGFSVVANEIKDLAERTALSTKEIDKLIQSVRQDVLDTVVAMDEGVASVEEGIELSNASAVALKKILESATKSAEMSNQIEQTTEEQARTAAYVSESVERVRAMVGQIARATAEQSKGVTLIIEAAEKMRDASHQADKATAQQAIGSNQISNAIESISSRTKHITNAIREQKFGSNQIWKSLEKIKNIPEKNRALTLNINREMHLLIKDTEMLNFELERFKLYTEADVIVFGVVPFGIHADLYRKLSPLVKYLGEQTGKRFELRIARSLDTCLNDLANGTLNLCFMNPVGVSKASKRMTIDCLAKGMQNGKPYYRAAIITREDSPISQLSDLKEASFAFVDKHSASGYLAPWAMMKEEGVELSSLLNYEFLGQHDDVLQAVMDGHYAAGSVIEFKARRFEGKGIRIIATSPEIPVFGVCAGELDKEVREKIKTALLGLNETNPVTISVLGQLDNQYTGFVEASLSDYESFISLISRVETY